MPNSVSVPITRRTLIATCRSTGGCTGRAPVAAPQGGRGSAARCICDQADRDLGCRALRHARACSGLRNVCSGGAPCCFVEDPSTHRSARCARAASRPARRRFCHAAGVRCRRRARRGRRPRPSRPRAEGRVGAAARQRRRSARRLLQLPQPDAGGQVRHPQPGPEHGQQHLGPLRRRHRPTRPPLDGRTEYASGEIRMATWSFNDWPMKNALVAAGTAVSSVQVIAAAASTTMASKRMALDSAAARCSCNRHPDDAHTGSFARECSGACRGRGGTAHSKYFLFNDVGSRHVREHRRADVDEPDPFALPGPVEPGHGACGTQASTTTSAGSSSRRQRPGRSAAPTDATPTAA